METQLSTSTAEKYSSWETSNKVKNPYWRQTQVFFPSCARVSASTRVSIINEDLEPSPNY